MEIPALLFSAAPHAPGPVQSILRPESLGALKQERAGELPLAYVVRNEDLAPLLRDMKDVVEDRGTKHKAKGLAILLLGYKKIPLIAGSYTDAGQLMRSVRTLLAHAAKTDDRNIYIIGADQKIFDELRAQAERRAAGVPSGPGSKRQESTAQTAGDSSGGKSFAALMALMPTCSIPDTLRKTLVGESDEIEFIRKQIVLVGPQTEPVLIMGETGSGKEVVARSIHACSPRAKNGDIVTVNCGAIPDDMLESELFGYVKGAFTGAYKDKRGLWEEAQDRTLFLDEVGDLTLRQQAKILRAMENQKIRRVGDTKDQDVNARIVAASNRDLFTMVQTGQFREDLFYRLRGFCIKTFPLRDHPEDIPLLARHFWRKIAKDGVALPETILAELKASSWPGNCRDLKFILTSMSGYCGTDNLRVEHLREIMRYHGYALAQVKGPLTTWAFDMHQMDCLRHLKKADEVVCAAQVAVRSLKDRKPANEADFASALAMLGQRLQELDVLCLHPLRFNSESTSALISRLKEKLAYFHGLISANRREALSFWKTELSGAFEQAGSAIFKEVGRLRKST